jgi:hypothetical protein
MPQTEALNPTTPDGLAGGEAAAGKIIYANDSRTDLPAVQPYTGQTYPDRIPDTYDVASRAALGVNALVGATNPLANHELYWQVMFARNPVVMLHDWNDWCQIKFMEALPLLRIASGSQQELHVDQVWQDVTLKSLGADGQFYIPMQGRPWAWKASCFARGIARPDGSLAEMEDPTVEQITHSYLNGRMLGTLLVHWLHDRRPLWLDAMRKMVDRMAELAIEREDYAYYPQLVYEPGASYDKTSPAAEVPTALSAGETSGRAAESLGKMYRLTGYAPARALGEKLVRFVRQHMDYFGPNGEFVAEKHFHAHTIYLLSMLEFATATGDRDTVEFVRKGYTWAKTEASGAADAAGYFPEVADPEWPSSETCVAADMIALALRLTAAGAGDYYNDAERWVRNHFAEAQLTDAGWVNEQAGRRAPTQVAYNETAVRAAERNVGAFAQSSSGNEFWVKGPDGIVHCCTGNATRTLYYLWRAIVDFADGVLSVNLLLNRASPWADVYSFIPYQGRVDIRVKAACELRVHAPAWVSPETPGLRASIDGTARSIRWDGRFLLLGAVAPGQTVQVAFPIAERTEQAVMSKKTYTLTIRGDTVVAVDPPGVTGPLYRREHFRQAEPRWVDVTRFVPDEVLDY